MKNHLSKNNQGGYRGESQSKCDEQEGTSFGQSYYESTKLKTESTIAGAEQPNFGL